MGASCTAPLHLASGLLLILTLGTVAACGDDGGATTDAAIDARSDASTNCQPLPARGTFNRRAGNPRLLPKQTSNDGKIDLGIFDPDVHWDGSQLVVYYGTPRGTTFSDPAAVPVIRRATSADRMAWTVDEAPVFTVDDNAWDRTRVEMPSVIVNPAAPADRRYLLVYAGASQTISIGGATVPDHAIGAAFSADGKTFTRVPASASPYNQDGLVVTGLQALPGAAAAVAFDPELALVDGVYHLWFTSVGCTGASCATISDRGVAHATSVDGITWTIREAPVRSLLRASSDRTSGGRAPSVIYDEVHCQYELWQTNDTAGEDDNQPTETNNMVGVWHAESTDGMAWSINYTRARELVWNASAPDPGEKLGLAVGADVADVDGGRVMLYVGLDDKNVPTGFTIPDRSTAGSRPGVRVMNVATRDLP